MKKYIKTTLFLLIILFVACRTVPVEPVPEPQPAPQPAPTPVHNPIVIFNTVSNPTTGYDWEIWIDNLSAGHFALHRLQKEDISKNPLGSPQKQQYTLRSTKSGRIVVHFIYKRPYDKGQETGRYIYTFNIADDLKISLLDTEKKLMRGVHESSLPVIAEPVIVNERQ